MKKIVKNKTKKENGITLIVLVIIIVVLLIISGVTIAVSMGNNRLIDDTQKAIVAAEIGKFKDKVTIAQVALELEIKKNLATESKYIATSSENFKMLAEYVAKDFGISAEDIINGSKETYKVASINKLQIATATSSAAEVQTNGYTISSALDIIGDNSTEGHGYITIWYTSKNLRSGIDINKELEQYGLSDALDTSNDLSKNHAMLVAIIHIKNNSSELIKFDLNDGNTTNYGLTTIENAINNTGKKLKETDYAVNTKEYTILTLNANNGTNEKIQEYMKVGNEYVVPENSYSREGYTFKAWNTLANGTGTNYNPGDIIKDTSKNIELYAKWEAIEYTISYELNGGTVTNPSTYTIESNNFTLNKPSKEGYYFTGWTGSNGNTPQSEVVIAKGSTRK